MIQRSQSIICMCALMLVGTRATAQIPPAEDSQQWTTVAAAWQVKPKLAISTFGEVHLGDDVSQFDQELASAGLSYPFLELIHPQPEPVARGIRQILPRTQVPLCRLNAGVAQ
jgi:hypothetical protein